MSKRSLILAVLLPMVLAGCASYKTAWDMRTNAETTHTFCSELPAREVFARLYEQTHACYHRIDEWVFINPIVPTKMYDIWVERRWSVGGGEVTIRTESSYTVVMDVLKEDGESCKTKVNVYLFNSLYTRAAKQYEQWVRNPSDDKCPA